VCGIRIQKPEIITKQYLHYSHSACRFRKYGIVTVQIVLWGFKFSNTNDYG